MKIKKITFIFLILFNCIFNITGMDKDLATFLRNITKSKTRETRIAKINTLIDIAYVLQMQWHMFNSIQNKIDNNVTTEHVKRSAHQIKKYISHLLPPDSIITYLKNKNNIDINGILQAITRNAEDINKLLSNPEMIKNIFIAKTNPDGTLQINAIYNFPHNFYHILVKILLCIDQTKSKMIENKENIHELSQYVDQYKESINQELYEYIKAFSLSAQELEKIIISLFCDYITDLTDVACLDKALEESNIIDIYEATCLIILLKINREFMKIKEEKNFKKIIQGCLSTYKKIEIVLKEYKTYKSVFDSMYKNIYRILNSKTKNLRNQSYLRRKFLGLMKSLDESTKAKKQSKQLHDLKFSQPTRSLKEILTDFNNKPVKKKLKSPDKKKTKKILPKQLSLKTSKKRSSHEVKELTFSYTTDWILKQSSRKLSELCRLFKIQNKAFLSLSDINVKNAAYIFENILDKYTYLMENNYKQYLFLRHVHHLIKHSKKYLNTKAKKEALSSLRQIIKTFEQDRESLEDLEVFIFKALLEKHHSEYAVHKKLTFQVT